MFDDPFDLLEAQRRIFSSHLRPLERLVALALLDHWSIKSPRPFASVTRLEQWTGLSRHPVVAALRGLREKGAIVVSESKNGSRHTYDLTPLMRLPVHEEHRSEPPTSAPAAPVQVAQPVHEEHRTGARGALPPVHEVHSKEPIEGTHLRNPRSRAGARKRSAPSQVSLIAEPEAPIGESSKHAQVVGQYFEAYEAEHGKKPTFTSEDGKAVKKLLEALNDDADEACRYVRNAFAGWRRKAITIRQIARDPAQFEQADTGTGAKRYQPQAGSSELLALGRQSKPGFVERAVIVTSAEVAAEAAGGST